MGLGLAGPLVFVGHSSAHHAGHSGYTQLVKYFSAEVIYGTHSMIPYSVRKWLSSKVDQSFGIYDSSSLEKDRRLILHMLAKRGGIAHYLNAERDVRFATRLKGPQRWNLVGTFHEPPEVILQCIGKYKYTMRLDAAIAVGMNQLEVIEKITSQIPIAFIPHGIDIDFFEPGNMEVRQKSCLFVGQHLRDFEFLEKVFYQILKVIPDFTLQAVIRRDYARLLPSHQNVKVYSDISDTQLRELYQRSSCLLLPLKEVTACNAILESLACGLPVITTRLIGNEVYLDDSSSCLVEKGNVNEMVDCAVELMRNETLNVNMRQISRKRSLQFAWQKVATQLQSFYQSNLKR